MKLETFFGDNVVPKVAIFVFSKKRHLLNEKDVSQKKTFFVRLFDKWSRFA